MDRLISASLATVLAAGAAPGFAAEAAADANAAADQAEIVVVGERGEYGVRSTSTATKTNTDLRDIPQAITVISERQIEDQQLRSIAELLTFVPGAMPGTGEGNRDQITLRGNNTTADFFVDGVRDDVQYFRDFYNADRIEILKGPNAMIFGRGGGGGVVNRVMKRSSLNPLRSVDISGDGFGGVRLTGDVDQPLGTRAGLRVNAMYENGDSFRRGVDLTRLGVNPTAGILLGRATRLNLSYEYLRDRRTADRGVPSQAGKPVEGFDRTFFGDPDNSNSRANVHLASVGLQHDFSDAVTIRNRTLFGNYDKFYENVYPSSAVTDRDGAGPQSLTVRLSAYNDETKRKNLFSQTDLVFDGQLAGMDQTLLVGFEVGRQKGHNQRRNGIFAASGTGPTFIDVPLSEPTVELDDLSFLANGANTGVRTNVAAGYVQEQLRPTRWLELVAGLRFDRLEMQVDNRVNGLSFGRTDKLWSPRLGLILKPRDNLSLYGSYSRSYLPQSGDQFNSLAANTETLKPERFDNIEFGGKWEPVAGLLATAAVYQLNRDNTRAVDPIDPTRFILSGEQRSRGIELGLERSISDRWQVSAGYARQKAKVIERTTACNPDVAECEVPLVPRHQLSLWNRYDVSSAFGVGLGVIARSKAFASVGNQVTLPGYARVDGALYYKLAGGMQAQINVENILNKHYFSSAHNDNNIAPGAPRTIKATVGYKF